MDEHDDRPTSVRVPAWLLAELLPSRPSPVAPEVYGEGPTARFLAPPDWSDFVVVWAGESPDERHIAVVGATRTLCDKPVRRKYRRASVLIVECAVCQGELPTRTKYLDHSG